MKKNLTDRIWFAKVRSTVNLNERKKMNRNDCLQSVSISLRREGYKTKIHYTPNGDVESVEIWFRPDRDKEEVSFKIDTTN